MRCPAHRHANISFYISLHWNLCAIHLKNFVDRSEHVWVCRGELRERAIAELHACSGGPEGRSAKKGGRREHICCDVEITDLRNAPTTA